MPCTGGAESDAPFRRLPRDLARETHGRGPDFRGRSAAAAQASHRPSTASPQGFPRARAGRRGQTRTVGSNSLRCSSTAKRSVIPAM